ncbi:class I SAM-dependent methyltransferase [Parasulfitobacter algicola]|uniref:Class I SAM-dependent methyltransferase n=1 Tax=Parasulfitobacter algicola TaxID=2614809 RepID=A0ABX2J0I7_9RHOB|nr:class I SAM-dependent methyltransferase [Sulfitobacter algicola]NSX56593.1 class I SAM-dependent methyltransferase [Sulfitobacter algicola]
MDISDIKSSYKRWAPIYDKTFGAITRIGRRKAVEYINSKQGNVLEIGVGTGLSLPHYKGHLHITGIDVSTDMLEKAREKVEKENLTHIKQLLEMDARTLDFPDDHFDTVVAMYLVSVVPEPEKVLAEMARVCKPGGDVLIINHFKRDTGLLAFLERMLAPLANKIGWHSDFDQSRVLGDHRLTVAEQKSFPPFKLFTFLRQSKSA